MPGFFATNFKFESDYTLDNYDKNRCTADSKIVDQNFFARNVLNSFLEDKLFADHDNYFIMTDGYLLNRESLIKQEQSSNFAEIVYRKSIQENLKSISIPSDNRVISRYIVEEKRALS